MASEEDKELCGKPSIDRSVPMDELLRLLTVFKDVPNERYPAKPERVFVDKVARSCRAEHPMHASTGVQACRAYTRRW